MEIQDAGQEQMIFTVLTVEINVAAGIDLILLTRWGEEFDIDPEATLSYVNAYREMWEEQNAGNQGNGSFH